MTPPSTDRTRPVGVGFLGAGPATQTIHLPTLARLGGAFRVAGVMDVDLDRAREVAAPSGARAYATEAELLADPDVECVVLCSPNALHAAQAVAACEHGVRAVLCEKPLATTRADGQAVVDAATRTGVPLLVGAMHLFDPAWVRARELWADAPADLHTVRSTIVLPPNAAFENAASESVPGPAPAGPPPDLPPSARIRGSVLGLAIHDLPLVRALTHRPGDTGPSPAVTVRSATFLPPFGYVVDLLVGDCSVLLQASFSPAARPSWTLEAYGRTQALELEFSPSYVHAGSGTARLSTTGSATQVIPAAPANGYEAEWLAVADILAGRAPAPDPRELLADLTFALDIADQSARLLDVAPTTTPEGSR